MEPLKIFLCVILSVFMSMQIIIKSFELFCWHLEMTDRINLLSKQFVMQDNELKSTRIVLCKLIDEVRSDVKRLHARCDFLSDELDKV